MVTSLPIRHLCKQIQRSKGCSFKNQTTQDSTHNCTQNLPLLLTPYYSCCCSRKIMSEDHQGEMGAERGHGNNYFQGFLELVVSLPFFTEQSSVLINQVNMLRPHLFITLTVSLAFSTISSSCPVL